MDGFTEYVFTDLQGAKHFEFVSEASDFHTFFASHKAVSGLPVNLERVHDDSLPVRFVLGEWSIQTTVARHLEAKE